MEGSRAAKRKPVNYWQRFNDWWRSALEAENKRPLASDINSWYAANADDVWGLDKPTLNETRVHAKCLRSRDSVRLYFRQYRAVKKRTSEDGEDDDDDEEFQEGDGSGDEAGRRSPPPRSRSQPSRSQQHQPAATSSQPTTTTTTDVTGHHDAQSLPPTQQQPAVHDTPTSALFRYQSQPPAAVADAHAATNYRPASGDLASFLGASSRQNGLSHYVADVPAKSAAPINQAVTGGQLNSAAADVLATVVPLAAAPQVAAVVAKVAGGGGGRFPPQVLCSSPLFSGFEPLKSPQEGLPCSPQGCAVVGNAVVMSATPVYSEADAGLLWPPDELEALMQGMPLESSPFHMLDGADDDLGRDIERFLCSGGGGGRHVGSVDDSGWPGVVGTPKLGAGQLHPFQMGVAGPAGGTCPAQRQGGLKRMMAALQSPRCTREELQLCSPPSLCGGGARGVGRSSDYDAFALTEFGCGGLGGVTPRVLDCSPTAFFGALGEGFTGRQGGTLRGQPKRVRQSPGFEKSARAVADVHIAANMPPPVLLAHEGGVAVLSGSNTTFTSREDFRIAAPLRAASAPHAAAVPPPVLLRQAGQQQYSHPGVMVMMMPQPLPNGMPPSALQSLPAEAVPSRQLPLDPQTLSHRPPVSSTHALRVVPSNMMAGTQPSHIQQHQVGGLLQPHRLVTKLPPHQPLIRLPQQLLQPTLLQHPYQNMPRQGNGGGPPKTQRRPSFTSTLQPPLSVILNSNSSANAASSQVSSGSAGGYPGGSTAAAPLRHSGGGGTTAAQQPGAYRPSSGAAKLLHDTSDYAGCTAAVPQQQYCPPQLSAVGAGASAQSSLAAMVGDQAWSASFCGTGDMGGMLGDEDVLHLDHMDFSFLLGNTPRAGGTAGGTGFGNSIIGGHQPFGQQGATSISGVHMGAAAAGASGAQFGDLKWGGGGGAGAGYLPDFQSVLAQVNN